MDARREATSSAADWLVGGGAMGDAVRSFDWSATALGPLSAWPPGLRVAVGLCLNSRFPMHVWWGPGLVNLYNDAHVAILGRRHPGALGRAAPDVWAEVWPLLAPQVEAVMRRGESTWNERTAVVLQRNGFPEDAWFTWSYSPIRDEAGRVGGLLCVSTEDTARVLAERERDRLEDEGQRQRAAERARAAESARDSATLLRGISDSTGDAIFAKDLGGRLRFANPATLALIGKPMAEVLGKTDAEFLDDAGAARAVMENDRRVMAGGVPVELEEVVPRPDGTRRVWLSRKVPNRDADGRVVGLLGVSRDITDRKAAEEALRVSQRRLTSLIESNIIGVHVCDDERVLEANDAYLRIVGYDRADLDAGRIAWRAITPPEHRSSDEAALAEVAGRGACAPYEKEYVRKDGTRVPVLIGVAGVKEQRARFICLVQDLTVQRQAEQARLAFLDKERAARAEAERAGRMKDEFLATLSHELRTPLNAILGWAQVLTRGSRDADDLAEGLATIERNARAQTQIIEDLLDMSRIISGKVRLDAQRLDLAAVVGASVDTLRHAADGKGVVLEVALDPLAGPVSGDPSRLQQVFWNLLSNAVKFTPRGGRVRVRLERVGAHVEVGVTDTGEGIDAAFLPYVFDRFRQSDSSASRRHGGLGLGLAIAKQLVELHGGGIRAESPGAGRGATFTISLPVAAAARAEPELPPERRRPSTTGGAVAGEACADVAGLTVLVVDDEPDARALVKRLLEGCHAVVVVAASAGEALERVRADRPDVIVSDIGLPGEDGYALIRQVRALGPERGGDTPAVALTAYARAEDRAKAVRAGFQQHVAKPVEPAELIAIIARLGKRPR